MIIVDEEGNDKIITDKSVNKNYFINIHKRISNNKHDVYIINTFNRSPFFVINLDEEENPSSAFYNITDIYYSKLSTGYSIALFSNRTLVFSKNIDNFVVYLSDADEKQIHIRFAKQQ